MKRIYLLILLIPILAAATWAQTDPVAILEYYDDELELQIIDENGFDVNFYLGIALNPGDQVITGNTSAEIRLDPNGSIVRVGPDTRFAVEGLQGRNDSQENRFALQRGKFRMVAARLAGEERYSVRTPSAVAGVRGTDFGMEVTPQEEVPADDAPTETDPEEAEPTGDEVPEDGTVAEGEPSDPTGPSVPSAPVAEELFVFSGEVAFESGLTGEEIVLTAGQRADALADAFTAVVMDAAEIARRRVGLEFAELDPAQVPQGEDEAPDEEPEDVAVEPVPTTPEEPAEEPDEGFGDRLFGTLAEITGLQVGSITINEETWAQAIFQPRISVGKLALELYLPITYRTNVFDPGDWYRPGGNDEWSFGSDQDWSGDPLGALQDLGTDVALKIKSLEWGNRGDGFYLKAGNISTFTIGQGLLMRNYANDIDFPTVRRIGFNLGFDLDRWGLETVVNDLAAPEIYAGRVYFRPAAPVVAAAVGISAVTDIAPGGGITTVGADGTPLPAAERTVLDATKQADPLFLNVAMDLEVPVLDRERLALIGFAEGGGLIPYLREDTTLGAETVNSGLKTDALVDFSSGELKNFGWTAGVRGRAVFLDYRLEFRSFDGVFRPSFYGPSYDRLRGTYAAETVVYLSDTEAEEYQTRTLGVNGEAGASIFGLIDLTAGYFWPWQITEEGDWRGSDQDELVVSVHLRDGLIPFGIETGLEYRRTHFASTVAGWGDYDDATLFDANTALDGYVAYPFNDVVRIVARVSTATVRNSDGEIVYDDNGNPRMAPTVAIQTQIGF